MVVIFGYCVVLFSAYLLYLGNLWVGGLIFCVGGWFAGGLNPSLRSLGVVMLVGACAVGFHHGVSVPVIVVGVIGFVLASRRRRRGRHDCSDGWGFDNDWSDVSDFGGDGDGDGDGDGGCGGDGGGGD